MRAHIAVVDDDPENAAALCEVLEAEGFQVMCFSGGEAAVEALTDGSAAFDAVVSDIRMPGVDGVGVLRAVQAVRPALPVILVSAFPEEEVWAAALRAGAIDVFPKPIQGAALAAVLREAIALARQRTAA